MRSRAIIVPFLLLAIGCGTPPDPVHAVLVCDRSNSAGCGEDLVRQAAIAFVDAKPPLGSTFTVLATGCSIDDVDRVYTIQIPAAWGSGVAAKKKAWREAEILRLQSMTLPALRRCSGIAAAIWRGARVLAEHERGVRQLVVVSDMREANKPLGVNLERQMLAPQPFVEKLRGAGLVADLSKIDLDVCGVHDRATPDAPRWTAQASEQLRMAWGAAFSAMGKSNVSLREECSFAHVGLAALAGEE